MRPRFPVWRTGRKSNLARPGGNITGSTQNSTEIAGKRLQLLRELVPKATRVATLTWDKILATLFLDEVRSAGKQMGITLINQQAGTSEELAGAFLAMQRGRAQGLIVQISPFTFEQRKRIIGLAMQARLPVMFESRESVDDGGLISYGPDLPEMSRRAAYYVDRIFKGAKPADLPVEQPTKFEMVINLKTAKALGLNVPQMVLLQADEVIK